MVTLICLALSFECKIMSAGFLHWRNYELFGKNYPSKHPPLSHYGVIVNKSYASVHLNGKS